MNGTNKEQSATGKPIKRIKAKGSKLNETNDVSEVELTDQSISGSDTDNEEKKYVKALGKNIEEKDGFRRGIHHDAPGFSGRIYG